MTTDGPDRGTELFSGKHLSWLWLGLPFIASLMLAALFNFIVNPFSLYGTPGLSSETFNYRKEKIELARTANPAPQAVIIGSSRTITIRPSDVEEALGEPCFNFGMVGARPEDYYAALRVLLDDLHLPVRDVILGVDHPAFNAAVPAVAESSSLSQFRRYFIHHQHSRNTQHGALPMLLSMEQTHASLNLLRTTLRGSNKASEMILPDGQVIPINYEEAIASGTFNLQSNLDKRIRKHPFRWLQLHKYTEPDPRGLAYLDSFLALCRERGINVYGYIAPCHPRQWEVIRQHPNYPVLEQVNQALAGEFARYGYGLHDLSTVESFGGDPDLFYDEIHMQPDNQARLLKRLFELDGLTG